MNSVADFLKRAAERNGFFRDRFDERNLPEDFSQICIMPFFGDYRSCVVLSTLLLHRYRQEFKGTKYFILASWPGLQGLFPYVDEYWSITDNAHLRQFYEKSVELVNKSDLSTIYTRNLNEFFRDVITVDEFSLLYNQGLTKRFFERFVDTKRFLPFVPSSTILGKDFNRDLSVKAGYKIFLHPSLFYKKWINGRSLNFPVAKEFWVELCEYLLEKGFHPVVWLNGLSHDISPDLAGKCIFIKETDVIRVLAAMRATGCVLDVFSDISRFAILARTPFVALDERCRYKNLKEYEIDDICGANFSNYIFTFSTLINGYSKSWSRDIFPTIVQRLEHILPNLNRENWPTTGESIELVNYKEKVRKLTLKKIGTHFIKVNKE